MTSLAVSSAPCTSVPTTTSQSRTILTGQFTNFIGIVNDQTSRTNATTGSNTLFAHADPKPQSGILSGSTGTDGLTLDTPKSSSKSPSITGLFSGTSNVPAVSLSAAPLLLSNTSSKANTTTHPSFGFQPSVASSSEASKPISGTSSNLTQTTAQITQNTTAGLFTFKTTSEGSTGSISQTTNVTGTSLPLGQSRGLSFPASAVTKATTVSGFSAPTVTGGNVSGGFTFATPAGQNTSAQKSSTFNAPTAEKPNTNSFSFTAPTNDKKATSGGFSFTAPTNDKQANSSGFTFTATTNNKQATSGGFNFTAPTNDKQGTSSGFSFTAPTNDKQGTSGGFGFTVPTNDKKATSGGFNFTAPTNNKGSASGGFTFTASTNDKQATNGGFSFTATTNDKASSSGGFQFTAPVVNNNNSNFAAPTVSTTSGTSGVFTFNAGNKSSNSAGFNFDSQNTPMSFNFGKLNSIVMNIQGRLLQTLVSLTLG